ncbi:MAG: GNAT family N-acetyltransferase [Acidimicrobiia bacterium]|nr:GNAT family N-acetyltransferase [Acidimicrobiia bacterium]
MIREYSVADVEAIIDVWYRASVEAHSFLPDEFFAAEGKLLQDRWLPEAETNVCVVNGAIVGFLSLVGNEVGGLFVDPDHQRRGIGSALMDGARDVRPFLELSVFEENRNGLAFYTAYGFEIVARRTNEETGRPELRLRLNPA